MAVFLTGGENGLRQLVPGGGVQQIAVFVRPQEAHTIAGIRCAGGVGNEDAAVAHEHRRPFIHLIFHLLPRVIR
ncbi:hypothetical protein D3C75_1286330 [compost metagenome]